MTLSSLFELDPESVSCPHRFYEHLRSEAPVMFSESLGAWVITRYDDILSVVGDNEQFSHRYPMGPQYARILRDAMADAVQSSDATPEAKYAAERGRWEVLFTADPPDHERQRKVVNRAFAPRQIKLAEPEVISTCEHLIDEFIDRGRVELISEFAWQVPLGVIAARLGVPTEDLPMFRRWSEDFGSLLGNHQFTRGQVIDLLTSLGEFLTYFDEKLTEARRNPQENILGLVVTADEQLDDDEMLGMIVQFLFAGNDTTTNLIGSAALHLARHPELADELRKDPTAVGRFVEEMLRLEPPTQGMYRRAKVDVKIADQLIPAGDHVFLSYASANRDESVFQPPHDLQLDRSDPMPHLAFGRGAHFCIGAPLARLEANAAMRILLERLDDIRVEDGATLEYRSSYLLRGLKRLPLTFTKRR